MTSSVPDYVARPYAPVHNLPARNVQWEGLSQDQLKVLRERLIESIIQVVVQAVKGFFIPGGGIGDALEQFVAIFEDALGTDFLTGPWQDLLDGLLDGSWPVNAVSLFGDLSSNLFSMLPINILAAPKTMPMTGGTFPNADSVKGAGVWIWDPTVTRTADGTGSMRVSANGTLRAVRGETISISEGQKITLSIWVKWFSYVGAGPTVQLHAVRFDDNDVELGTDFVAQITPTSGTAGGWTELTGAYTVPSGVAKIRPRFSVTSGATSGQLNFDDGTYTVSSNFIDNLTQWFRVPAIGDLFTDPLSFIPSDLIPEPVRNTIDTVFQAITGLVRVDNLLSELADVLRAIPFGNILGVGGPANIGSSVLGVIDSLVGGFVGAIGTGASIADIFNIGNLVSSNATRGGFAFDILGILNNKQMWDGLLPTSSSTIPLSHIDTGGAAPYTFGVTSSTAVTGWKRFTQAMPLGVISWLGNGTTSITDMRVNIWKMDPLTGIADLVHTSANIIGDIVSGGTADYNTYEIPDPIAVSASDVYGAEIEVRSGAGTHTVAGQQAWLGDHPTAFPRRMQSTRNSGGSAPPSSISAGTMNGLYGTNRPFIEFAVETGPGSEFHEPQVVQFTSSDSVVIPNWANKVDRVLIPAGGGGAGGTTAWGFPGTHGNTGVWTRDTLTRGTHFSGTPTATITLGNPGTGGALFGNGSNASNSTIAVTGASTLTATGGTGGSGVGNAAGPGPGDLTYQGQTYHGGVTQNTFGADGTSPGGAGAGGDYLGTGGDGGHASAWLVFRQS